MNLQRGMRDKLDKYMNPNQSLDVYMDVSGGAVYDYCCFGVDANGKLSDDRYMVFYNQTTSPGREIQYFPNGSGARFSVNLGALPATIVKLVFTVSIDGSGTMGDISQHSVRIQQGLGESIGLDLRGTDFRQEKAIISIEIYKKDVWRFAAVASGFNGGLGDLLRSYGGSEASARRNPPPQPQPQPQPRPAPGQNQGNRFGGGPTPPADNLPRKVELRKGEKVNLRKSGSSLGEILINLNWSQPQKKGFFAPTPQPIDLDLGCLFEFKNGFKGCVQALGNTFGSLTLPPYIALDGDDRSGSSANGENLRVNGKMISEIKRILVYTFIYEGAANWKEANGVVTVKCPGSQEIVVRMDEYGSTMPMCAIALLENNNDETFSVEKIVRFYRGHRFMDQDFNWGLNWVPGRK